MKRLRLMNNNFLDSVFSYSSQLSGFPALNSTNKSRSKVWKPAGNFEITSTNNKIYINDGSDKTITLTSGTYTYSTLASHIQTQLNASSSNWTCTYNSSTTFKFTIDRSSGTEVLRLSQTTNAAWDTLGFTGVADTSAAPFVADEQRNHTSEWVKCDLGVPQLATFAAIISGIDELFTLSQTATVKLQANNIDLWTSPPVNITIPVGDASVMRMLEDDNTSTYRYWRFEIIDKYNPGGPEGFEFSYIYIGDYFSITLSNIAQGFTKELVDPSIQLQSESGALFFETKPRYLSLSNCQIQLLSGEERKDLEQLFYELGVRDPFFVSIDPGVEVTEDLEDLTRFVVMTSPPRLDNVFRNYYNISFEMREAF